MNKKAEHSERTADGDIIEVGRVDNSTGVAIGREARSTVTQGGSFGEESVNEAFNTLYQALSEKPDSLSKRMALEAVKTLEAEAKKEEQAREPVVNEGFVALMKLMPDIWEVAISTFINPIQGLSTVFRKVAERAKALQESR